MKRTLVVLATVAAILAGCSSGGSGGSGGSTADATPAPTPLAYNVPREISAQQLQSITLALPDFGPRYSMFVPVVDSELTAVLERAIDACDPIKEQAALSKYGWAKAYTRTFGVPDDGSIPSTLTVGTVVDIFSSPENASIKIKYDAQQIREDQRSAYGCQGVRIERVEEFAAPGLGDQSWGVKAHFNIEGVAGSTQAIVFRRDRIVATVSVTRLNSEDSSAELLALAQQLDARLLPVLTAPLTMAQPSADTPAS